MPNHEQEIDGKPGSPEEERHRVEGTNRPEKDGHERGGCSEPEDSP